MAKRRTKKRRVTLRLHCALCRANEEVPRHIMLRAAQARCSSCGGRLVRFSELPPIERPCPKQDGAIDLMPGAPLGDYRFIHSKEFTVEIPDGVGEMAVTSICGKWSGRLVLKALPGGDRTVDSLEMKAPRE